MYLLASSTHRIKTYMSKEKNQKQKPLKAETHLERQSKHVHWGVVVARQDCFTGDTLADCKHHMARHGAATPRSTRSARGPTSGAAPCPNGHSPAWGAWPRASLLSVCPSIHNHQKWGNVEVSKPFLGASCFFFPECPMALISSDGDHYFVVYLWVS